MLLTPKKRKKLKRKGSFTPKPIPKKIKKIKKFEKKGTFRRLLKIPKIKHTYTKHNTKLMIK
jgi:hypothetical protein